MPIYAYRCSNCGHAQDVLQKMSDPLLTVCPVCGQSTYVKQVTAAGFQLKGSGWYVTDFRGGDSTGKPATEAGGDAGKGGDAPTPEKKSRRRPTSKGGDGKGGDCDAARATVRPRRRLLRRRPHPHPGPRRHLPRRAPHRPLRTAAFRQERQLTRRPTLAVKKYLLAGLLVWLPLAVTIWVLQAVLGLAQRRLRLAPQQLAGGAARRQPLVHRDAAADSRPGRDRAADRPAASPTCWPPTWPASGPSARATGCSTGSRSSSRSTARCSRCPTRLFSSSGNAFREAVLVQYPREGTWTIAFVTGKPGGEAANHLPGDYLSIYVPTTPNPTSGFFLMLPREDAIAAGDERRRRAQVRDLDGRRRATCRDGGGHAAADPKLDRLSVRPRSAFARAAVARCGNGDPTTRSRRRAFEPEPK